MFQRFAVAAAVGALVIALAALVLLLSPGVTMSRIWPLTTVWCFVPFFWGIWAILAPKAWLPNRLPLWGAFLGLLGGTMGGFVLNLPSRVFQAPVSVATRLWAVAAVTVLYYFLWMLVRIAYRSLIPGELVTSSADSFPMKKAA